MDDGKPVEEITEEKSPPKKTNGAVSPIVIKLRKNVIANGDEVSELTFREPTAGDIERVGNPVNLQYMANDDFTKVTFESRSMTAMMALLAAVPPSTIRQMHPKDWNTAAWLLADFFAPDL
jgi:Phage tail assembly chaperone proteins, E, or 41 or 14